MRRFVLFVASGFSLGLFAPVAPGTIGSLPGVALCYLAAGLPLVWQIVCALAFTLLAIPFCDAAEKILRVKDDGRITADEWMLLPIATIGIPLLDLPWWMMAVFFVVVRVIDIVKPWPCRQLQAIPGGRGIVIDDFIANLYALAVNWAIYAAFLRPSAA